MHGTGSFFSIVLYVVSPCFAFDIDDDAACKGKSKDFRHEMSEPAIGRTAMWTYASDFWNGWPPMDSNSPRNFHMDNSIRENLDVDSIRLVRRSQCQPDFHPRTIPKRCSTANGGDFTRIKQTEGRLMDSLEHPRAKI